MLTELLGRLCNRSFTCAMLKDVGSMKTVDSTISLRRCLLVNNDISSLQGGFGSMSISTDAELYSMDTTRLNIGDYVNHIYRVTSFEEVYIPETSKIWFYKYKLNVTSRFDY